MIAGDDAVIMRHQVEANAAYFGVQPIVLEGVAHDLMLVSHLIVGVRVCACVCVRVCVCARMLKLKSVPDSFGTISSDIPHTKPVVATATCSTTLRLHLRKDSALTQQLHHRSYTQYCRHCVACSCCVVSLLQDTRWEQAAQTLHTWLQGVPAPAERS